MKIADIRTVVVGNPWKNWIYVIVETDDGMIGVGEATGGLETQPRVAAVEEVKHLAIGMDPRNIHEIFHKIHLATYLNISAAMTGIEMACWDILGKSLGVPVYTLLGGKVRDNVRVYANGWYSGDRTPEGFAEKAKEVVNKGYTALKFDPFGDAHMQLSRKETAEAKALVGAVREAVGDEVDILIEAHDRFDTFAAIEIGNWLKDYEVTWFETPVMSNDVQALVEVARRVPVRVIAGERMQSTTEFADFLSNKVTDVINPEPLKVGGIWKSLQIAGIAAANHAEIALHNAESPFKTMVALHIDAVTPNVFIQECFDDFMEPWVNDVLSGFHRVKDGYLEMPTAPGIGVELNEEEAKKHPYGKSNFLRMFRPGWEKRDTAQQE
jgi:galactonate dehydratase